MSRSWSTTHGAYRRARPAGRAAARRRALLLERRGAYVRTCIDGPGAGRFAASSLLTLTGSLGAFIAGDLGGSTWPSPSSASPPSAWSGMMARRAPRTPRRSTCCWPWSAEACLLLAFALSGGRDPRRQPRDPRRRRRLAHRTGAGPDHRPSAGRVRAEGGAGPAACSRCRWRIRRRDAGLGRAGGAIVKAGVIGFIRFLPAAGAVPEWGFILGGIGLLTAFGAFAAGLTQRIQDRAGLFQRQPDAGGECRASARPGGGGGRGRCAVAFYALCHMLAKGALFLGVGVAMASGRRWLWLALGPAVVLALGFGGLPGTGGHWGRRR